MKRHSWPLLLLSAVLVVATSRIAWLTPVALFALVPALCALEGKSLKTWAWESALLFFLIALGGFYWLFHVGYHFGQLPIAAALLLVPVFALLNIWQGVVGFVAFRWLRDRLNLPPALLFALCFVTAWHFIPALFFWDFSLLVRRWSWLIQGVDLFGAIGIDFLLAFINYAIYQSWRARRAVPAAYVALGLLVVTNVYGAWRVATLAPALADAPKMRVALVQPNIPSDIKTDPASLRSSLQHLLTLSNKVAAQKPDLIVWPESVIPIPYEQSPQLRSLLNTHLTRWKAALLFGTTHFEQRAGGGWKSFNSAALFVPGMQTVSTYYKHVLLAFGEFIPLEDRLPIIREWFPDRVGQFGRGPGPQALRVNGFALSPVICYESIISDYMRRTALLPTDLIVELTNDGWYGTTSALYYHRDLTALRAIENRIGIARDTNTGFTTLIDPLGREHGTLPLEVAQTTLTEAPQLRPYAFFTHWGYHAKTVLGLMTLGLLLTGLVGRFSRRQ